MRVTQAMLAPFVGGQIEIESRIAMISLRGKITAIKFTDVGSKVQVQFILESMERWKGKWESIEFDQYTVWPTAYQITRPGGTQMRFVLKSLDGDEFTLSRPKGS